MDLRRKRQRYTRIGAQEYVPFDQEELTTGNIKEACQKHCASQIEKYLVIDVLAGERVPSCGKMVHIPSKKVYSTFGL